MTDDLPYVPGADEDRNGHRPDGMTVLQRAFAENYVRLLGEGEGRGIKKMAAIAAGYAESDASNAASKNLRHPAIVTYIAGQLTASTAEVGVTPSFVLFKAMTALETAEATGNVMGMMRALELIHRHVDVRAAFGLSQTAQDPDGGPAAYDLSSLNDEELLQYLALRRKLAAQRARADDTGHRTGAGAPPAGEGEE